jgi:hypothetical protein
LNAVVGLAVAEFVDLVTGYMCRAYRPQLTYYAIMGKVKPTVYEVAPPVPARQGSIRLSAISCGSLAGECLFCMAHCKRGY